MITIAPRKGSKPTSTVEERNVQSKKEHENAAKSAKNRIQLEARDLKCPKKDQKGSENREIDSDMDLVKEIYVFLNPCVGTIGTHVLHEGFSRFHRRGFRVWRFKILTYEKGNTRHNRTTMGEQDDHRKLN